MADATPLLVLERLPRAPLADKAAFHALFAAFATIGATPAGGVHRLAGDPHDGEARDHLCAWLRDHGFDVRIDAVGNVFGLLVFQAGAPFVLVGSHLDSQPAGGRFDGALGVVAACIAAKAIAEGVASQGLRPAWNLAVVNWTNEEGARFQPSLMGSGVFCGQISSEAALGARDEAGTSLQEALRDIGYIGCDAPPAPIACGLELHVEQGRELELSGDRIGIVVGSWAALKYLVRFLGEPSHTGPTRMQDRRDALLAAAKAIVMVRDLAETSPGPLHTSVGRIEISPNSPNVVAARVDVRIELRAPTASFLSDMVESFEERLASIAAATGTMAEITSRSLRQQTALDPRLAGSAAAVARSRHLKFREMTSVAGHDALALAARHDSALIFVPSAGGISHSEREFTADDEMEDGLDVFTDLAWRLCLGGSTVVDVPDEVRAPVGLADARGPSRRGVADPGTVVSPGPDTRLAAFLARDAASPWAQATCRQATVAVSSPMRRATEWTGFWVEAADGTVCYAKLLDDDMKGRIDVSRSARASERAGEAGIAPRLIAADAAGGVLLFEALREGWRWARLGDIDTPTGLAAAIALRQTMQDGPPLGWARHPVAEIATLAAEATATGAVLPDDLSWMLRLAQLAGNAIAAAGVDSRPCHGDGIASNHMIHANGTLKLVDFDSAGDMDPIYDLATLLVETSPLDDGFEAGLEMATGSCRRADLSRIRLYAAIEDLHRALFAAVLAKSARRSDLEFFKYAQWRFLRARMGFGDGRFEYWLRTL